MIGDWILIIAVGGFASVVDIQVHRNISEAQCRGMLEAMLPLQPRVGAACVGPSGEVVEAERGQQ